MAKKTIDAEELRRKMRDSVECSVLRVAIRDSQARPSEVGDYVLENSLELAAGLGGYDTITNFLEADVDVPYDDPDFRAILADVKR